MTQPKTPPISIRLPDDLAQRIEAWAAEQKLARNAAIKVLLERGLGMGDHAVVSRAKLEKVKAAAKAVAAVAEPTVPLGPPPSVPGSRLKKR